MAVSCTHDNVFVAAYNSWWKNNGLVLVRCSFETRSGHRLIRESSRDFSQSLYKDGGIVF